MIRAVVVLGLILTGVAAHAECDPSLLASTTARGKLKRPQIKQCSWGPDLQLNIDRGADFGAWLDEAGTWTARQTFNGGWYAGGQPSTDAFCAVRNTDTGKHSFSVWSDNGTGGMLQRFIVENTAGSKIDVDFRNATVNFGADTTETEPSGGTQAFFFSPTGTADYDAIRFFKPGQGSGGTKRLALSTAGRMTSWAGGVASTAYQLCVESDQTCATPRFKWGEFGEMSWGSGSGAPDVTLSRSAADTLALGSGDSLVGAVQDKGGAVYNVKSYGAKCNGTADDVLAIEAALAVACAASRGTVLIPGSCGIADSIDFPASCNNVTLAGNGPGSRLVNVAGADVSRGMILADWTGLTQATRIVIRDLDLVGGTSLSAAFKRGVQVKNCARCAVKNLTITGVDGNPSTGSDVYGIELRDDVVDAKVKDNTIVFATTTSSDTAYKIGILVRSSMVDSSNGNTTGATPLPATTKRTQVYGNSVYGGTHGINCQNVEDLDIVGNVLQSQGHRGMGLGGTSTNITVAGNTVRDSGSVNLLFAGGATRVTVVGNTLDTASGGENANIQMYYTIDHAVVSGNTCRNASYGVRVQYDARDVLITGNNILSTGAGKRGVSITGAMTSGYTDLVYAGASVSDIVVSDNQIRLGTSGIGVHLLGQETGTVQGTVNLDDITVRGNVIDGSTSSVGVKIEKNGGGGTLDAKVLNNHVNAPTGYSTDFANFIDTPTAGQTATGADNGTGTAATVVVTPQYPQVQIDCQDSNGCVGANSGSISEAIASFGDKVTLVSVGTYAVTISDVAGLTELEGDWVGGTYDTLSLLYTGTRWVEIGRSNN